jgi:hypothetical protein
VDGELEVELETDVEGDAEIDDDSFSGRITYAVVSEALFALASSLIRLPLQTERTNCITFSLYYHLQALERPEIHLAQR